MAYRVAPPSFVRTWYSNVYTTNGVTIYTNIVTNTIGWQIDRAMMVSLDATIKLLVTNYVNTNVPGATLTVTGLWATLGIGDKTNKFTSTPCWTNPVQTNYLICYTSYWPTNGANFPTTNNYTSTVNQIINYGTNWDGTNVGWGTISNWPSEIVRTTNAATYGDYPWQIYVGDLEERYKVLYSLKYISNSPACMVTNDVVYVWYERPSATGLSPTWSNSAGLYGGGFAGLGEVSPSAWADIMTYVETDFEQQYAGGLTAPDNYVTATYLDPPTYVPPFYVWWQNCLADARSALYYIGPFSTTDVHSVTVEARSVAYGEWGSQGAIGTQNEWVIIIDVTNSLAVWHVSGSYGSLDFPEWFTNDPSATPNIEVSKGNTTEAKYSAWYGTNEPSRWVINYLNIYGLTNSFGTNWCFSYCTNKYW